MGWRIRPSGEDCPGTRRRHDPYCLWRNTIPAVVAADEEVETPVTRLRQMVLPIQEVQRVWISLVGLAPSDVRRLAPDDRWWVSATEPYLPVFGKTPDELVHALQRPSTPRGLFRG